MKKDENHGSEQPVFIIKKKSGHGGHHGGAWKIAYADFVTAMMALFLVLWLISKSTPTELKGIAEYFRNPSIGISGGEKMSDSESPIPGGGDDITKDDGEKALNAIEPEQIGSSENMQLVDAAREVHEYFQQDEELKELEKNLTMEITDRGLLIQILETNKEPMFTIGSAKVNARMKKILYALAPILNTLKNKIILSGHTDERQYAKGDRGYSNWELSADRANASRIELIVGGLSSNKITSVVALADTVSLNKNFRSDSDRRISLLILNHEAEDKMNADNNISGTDLIKQFESEEKQNNELNTETIENIPQNN